MKHFTRQQIRKFRDDAFKLVARNAMPNGLDTTPESQMVRHCDVCLNAETDDEFFMAEAKLRQFIRGVRTGDDPLRSEAATKKFTEGGT